MRRRAHLRTAAESSLLILGPARSGTTMIASMLGAHPSIGVVTEDLRMVFTRISGKPVVGNKLCIPHQIQLDRRSSLAKQVLRAGLEPIVGARRVLSIDWLAPQAHHSIEDYLTLPDLHVVGVLRGHEATTRSAVVRAGRSPQTATRRWEAAMLTLHRLAHDPRFTMAVVDYDAVVAAPEQAARALCAFLDLTFENRMMDGARLNPIYPGRTGIGPVEPHTIVARIPTPSPDALAAYEDLLATCLT